MLSRRIIRYAIAALFVRAHLNAARHIQPIIIDTDLMTDVDDIGALAIANVLHNCGLADLRGIAINTQSKYGAAAASVSSPRSSN